MRTWWAVSNPYYCWDSSRDSAEDVTPRLDGGCVCDGFLVVRYGRYLSGVVAQGTCASPVSVHRS